MLVVRVDQGNNRHLRPCEKTDRRPPGTGAPAHIEYVLESPTQVYQTGIIRGGKLDKKGEGKDLPFVGMPRKLKVEKIFCLFIYNRPVF